MKIFTILIPLLIDSTCHGRIGKFIDDLYIYTRCFLISRNCPFFKYMIQINCFVLLKWNNLITENLVKSQLVLYPKKKVPKNKRCYNVL